MKLTKKLLSLLLCAMMLVTAFVVTSYAADGATNVALGVEKTEVNVGDIVTVTLSYSDMAVASFAAGIRFDTDYLECVSIVGCDPEYPDEIVLCKKRGFNQGICSKVDEANGNGRVGFVYAYTEDVAYVGCDIYTVTFTAKKAGTTTITAFEKSDGTDGFDGDAATATLTIKASAPACDHSTTKAVPNGDGATHKLVCTNEACNGHVVTASVECSGGEATCTEKAVCSACGAAYGNVKGHGQTHGFRYDNNNNGTHNQYCLDCETMVKENITCTFDANTHACVCNAVETFTVTYVYNGGNWGGSTENEVRSIPYGYELIPNDGSGSIENGHTTWVSGVQKTGYTFVGWKADTNGQVYDPTTDTYTVTGNVTFTAQWELIHVCALTHVPAAEATCTTAGHKAYYVCECTKAYEDDAATDPIEDLAAWKSAGGDGYIAPDSTNHASDKVNYTNNGKNHSATYDCCGAVYVTNEAHTYTNHVCVCDAVERFVLLMDATGGKFGNGDSLYAISAAYGDPFNAVPDDPTKEGYKFVGWNTKADGTGDDIDLTPGKYVFKADLTVYAQWEVVIHSGWNEIDGEWYYYLDEQTKATGLTRVPYPTVAIDNVTYAPNADDLAYYNSHKDTSKYSDATTAVFYFDENGVFQNDYTGPVANGSSYAVNGMAPWHVGMVKIGEDFYYFSGDKENGGNVMVTGKVYATRDCGTGLRVGSGVIYIFDGEGKLEKNQGIVDGYYYNDDYTLAIGAGLIQIDTDYYYVRSNGVVVVNREYWVAKTNDLEVVAGLYTFDADGKMVNPLEFDGAEDGIVELNGDLYYIKDGKCVVGAGVVKLTDAEGATFYIYVKSSGKLATGNYWPTNLNGLLTPGMYNWGTDGKYYPAAN